jgi:hypothetical protein
MPLPILLPFPDGPHRVNAHDTSVVLNEKVSKAEA